jgi:hypothetical protein
MNTSFAKFLSKQALSISCDKFVATAQFLIHNAPFSVTDRSAFLAQLGFIKGQIRSHFDDCMARFWASVQPQEVSIQTTVETVSESIVETTADVATVVDDVISRAGISIGQKVKSVKRLFKKAVSAIQVLAVDIKSQIVSVCAFASNGAHEIVEMAAIELERLLLSKCQRRDMHTIDMFG